MRFFKKTFNWTLVVLVFELCNSCSNYKFSDCKDFLNNYNKSIGFETDLKSLQSLISEIKIPPIEKKLHVVHFINLDCGNCIESVNNWVYFMNSFPIYKDRIILLIYGENISYFHQYIDKSIYEKITIIKIVRQDLIYQSKLKINSFLLNQNMEVVTYGDLINDELFRNNINCLLKYEGQL